MSTFLRVIITIIEFGLLFLFEFFHIKNQIKRSENDEKKSYKKFAAIFYTIINITVIALFIFLFPNHIFLCYNKLVFLGCIILVFICSVELIISCVKKIPNTFSIFLLFPIVIIGYFLAVPITGGFDFKDTLNIEKSNEVFSDVNNITKLNDQEGNIIYLVDFKGNDKETQVIYEYQVSDFEISDKTFISKETTITTMISPELKDAKEYTISNDIYNISVTDDILIDKTTFK